MPRQMSKLEKKICIRKLTQRPFQEYIACEIGDWKTEIVRKRKVDSYRQAFFRGKRQAILNL